MIPGFSKVSIAVVWNSFSLSSLETNFYVIIILDMLYFVTSLTLGIMVLLHPHTYHLTVFINMDVMILGFTWG